MKTVLIMRHAKSSWKEPVLDDHERPLNKRGKQNAPRMGRLLREMELVPDLVLSSTARRARDTAEAVIDQCRYKGELRLEQELYAAPAEAYLQALRELDNSIKRVLLVGHNPGLEELVYHLTGEQARLPTAAVAQVKLPIKQWQDLSDDVKGQLVNLWRPKELP